MRRIEDTGSTTRPTSWLVRGLAVVGALTLVAAVVLLGWYLVVSRPGSTPTDPVTTSPTATTPGPPEAEPTPSMSSGEAFLPDIDVVTERLLTDEVELRDVKIDGRGARRAPDGSVRVDHLEVDAVVPFASVEKRAGGGIRLTSAGDGLVRAAIPVDVFGRRFDAVADARVRAEGDRIAIDPVRVVGAGYLDQVVDRIGTIRQPVPGLPTGMTVTAIEVTPEGFKVHATGEGVSLPK